MVIQPGIGDEVLQSKEKYFRRRTEGAGMEDVWQIAVVGSGYVGLVAAVCFAEIGHRVICVDNDEAKVSRLTSGNIPIFEEHLPVLFNKHHMRRIEFTSDLRYAVEESDAIFVAVGTPQSSSGA